MNLEALESLRIDLAYASRQLTEFQDVQRAGDAVERSLIAVDGALHALRTLPEERQNWYYKIAGGHTHVRVFMNGGCCGNLCYRNEEFQAVMAKSSPESVNFINETEA